jgi:hypothetical protein
MTCNRLRPLLREHALTLLPGWERSSIGGASVVRN